MAQVKEYECSDTTQRALGYQLAIRSMKDYKQRPEYLVQLRAAIETAALEATYAETPMAQRSAALTITECTAELACLMQGDPVDVFHGLVHFPLPLAA